MANALYLLLLTAIAVVVVINLRVAAQALRAHGLPVLFEVTCHVAGVVLLFLSLWLPFHSRSPFGRGWSGNLISLSLGLFYLPGVLNRLRGWRKRVQTGNIRHSDGG